jgi:hypothetical protein
VLCVGRPGWDLATRPYVHDANSAATGASASAAERRVLHRWPSFAQSHLRSRARGRVTMESRQSNSFRLANPNAHHPLARSLPCRCFRHHHPAHSKVLFSGVAVLPWLLLCLCNWSFYQRATRLWQRRGTSRQPRATSLTAQDALPGPCQRRGSGASFSHEIDIPCIPGQD